MPFRRDCSTLLLYNKWGIYCKSTLYVYVFCFFLSRCWWTKEFNSQSRRTGKILKLFSPTSNFHLHVLHFFWTWIYCTCNSVHVFLNLTELIKRWPCAVFSLSFTYMWSCTVSQVDVSLLYHSPFRLWILSLSFLLGPAYVPPSWLITKYQENCE